MILHWIKQVCSTRGVVIGLERKANLGGGVGAGSGSEFYTPLAIVEEEGLLSVAVTVVGCHEIVIQCHCVMSDVRKQMRIIGNSIV